MQKKFTIVLIIFLVSILSDIKAQCSNRYKERVFNNIQVFRDVVYSKDATALVAATLTTETTINKDLVMDVFMPPLSDTVTKRPAIVIGHGGGFINVLFMGGTLLVGTMDNDDVQALADTLAHWGYVTAVIEYRLGFNPSSATSIKRAIWRGAQDMSTAVRFFRKNSNWFGVDEELVFSSGSSAGAFCAIHSTFVDYTERISESYELVPFFMKNLGAMHSRPVVELSSFDTFNGNNVPGDDVDSIPFGVAAYWGATMDLNWLNINGNHAPMIMFHGDSDLVVNNKCARPFASVIPTAPVTCGSYMMDSILNLENIESEVYYGPGEGHEYWGVLNGNWISPNGPNNYFNDIINKTSAFFYKLAKPDLPTILGPNNVNAQNSYTYSIQNPDPNADYCWEIQNGSIVSSDPFAPTIDVQFNNTSNANIFVKEIDEHDFVSDSAKMDININLTSVNKYNDQLLDFNIHPNPAKNMINLNISTIQVESEIDVYDISGIKVYEKKLYPGINSQKISIYNLNAGVYYVVIKNSIDKLIRKALVIN